MPLNKEDKTKYQKEYMRKRRSNKSQTEIEPEGLTNDRDNKGLTGLDRAYIGLFNIISTPEKKRKLMAILRTFEQSNSPENMQNVRLGAYGFTLEVINDMVTSA